MKELNKPIRSSTLIDFAHGRLSPDESLELLSRMEHDPRASERLDLIVDLMNEASDPASPLFEMRVPERDSIFRRIGRSVVDTLRTHPILAPSAGFGALAAAVGIVVLVNVFTVNKLEELAGIDRTAFVWNSRGSDNSDLAGAYFFFTNGEYERSLGLLDRYLREYPGGELTPYVHYTSGAVALLSSRRSLLTIIHIRNSARVKEGLDQLSLALSQTSNQRLKEEARFLRAKGFLMLGDARGAIAELDSLRALDGPREEEAMQMIERIHALTP